MQHTHVFKKSEFCLSNRLKVFCKSQHGIPFVASLSYLVWPYRDAKSTVYRYNRSIARLRFHPARNETYGVEKRSSYVPGPSVRRCSSKHRNRWGVPGPPRDRPQRLTSWPWDGATGRSYTNAEHVFCCSARTCSVDMSHSPALACWSEFYCFWQFYFIWSRKQWAGVESSDNGVVVATNLPKPRSVLFSSQARSALGTGERFFQRRLQVDLSIFVLILMPFLWHIWRRLQRK